jgi:hypothetical protein
MDPRLSRRQMLEASAALGVTSLMLPSAVVHASGTVLAVTGTAINYTGTEYLLRWSLTNPTTQTYPVAPADVPVGSGLSGGWDRGGATLTPLNDSRNIWIVTNSATELDIATAPYFEAALTTTTKAVQLTTLSLGGLSADPGFTVTALTDVDGYTTILRQESVGTEGDYKNFVVNLTGLPTVTTNSTVRVRLYVHNAPGTRVIAVASGAGAPGYPPVVSPEDDYNSAQGFRNVSFIGQVIE